ncbi:MAG: thioredoxin-disulfide reductase [Ignavibacteriaceae bacterium]
MFNEYYDTIVIGGGPAGLTAGIYLSRSKMKTLILNEGTVGGQIILTHEIANYPGIEKISGYQLANVMKNQAKSFGCEIKSNIKINSMNLTSDVKTVEINNKEIYSAGSVIFATGGRSRNLNVPGEDKFRGKGISYCATCDGDFFQDKNIIVVGGGNSALEEAVSLTKYASKVTIVHQFEDFQAFEHAIEEAQNNSKINFIMESKIKEFIGENSLEKVIIENQKTLEISEMDISGVFIFIGYQPNTESLKGIISLNDKNEIIVNENLETSIPGVFAAGDSINKKYRQITTAVADGTIAALSAIEYSNNIKILNQV